MATSVLCPSCGHATTFGRLPILECPGCRAAYPDTLRVEAERALAVALRRRPGLLTFGMYWSALGGMLCLVFMLLAPFDIGTYSINGEAVSGPEFLRRIGVLWAANGVTMLLIGYAIWKELPWSRPVMMFWWLILTVILVVSSLQDGTSPLGSLFMGGLCAAVAAWYLYGRDNVVGYYNSLVAQPPRPTM